MQLIPGSYGQSRLVSMLGVAGQQVEGVREKAQDGAQTTLSTRRAAWKVDDQRSPSDAAHAAAKGCKRRFLHAAETNLFGDTRNEAFTYRESRFGSHVAFRNSGAACR